MFAMRSNAGVGITPPNVLGAAKPTSSVMIRSTLGAPFGGTIRAGQDGWDWAALGLMSPSNFCGGLGRYFPSIVVVASREPGTPVFCCAIAAPVAAVTATPTPNWGRVTPLRAMTDLRLGMNRPKSRTRDVGLRVQTPLLGSLPSLPAGCPQFTRRDRLTSGRAGAVAKLASISEAEANVWNWH